MYCVEIIQWIM